MSGYHLTDLSEDKLLIWPCNYSSPDMHCVHSSRPNWKPVTGFAAVNIQCTESTYCKHGSDHCSIKRFLWLQRGIWNNLLCFWAEMSLVAFFWESIWVWESLGKPRANAKYTCCFRFMVSLCLSVCKDWESYKCVVIF